MNATERKEYDALPSREARAKWLLSKGVNAQLTINPATLSPAYQPIVAGVILETYYDSEEKAVKSTTEWLTDMSNAKMRDGA